MIINRLKNKLTLFRNTNLGIHQSFILSRRISYEPQSFFIILNKKYLYENS